MKQPLLRNNNNHKNCKDYNFPIAVTFPKPYRTGVEKIHKLKQAPGVRSFLGYLFPSFRVFACVSLLIAYYTAGKYINTNQALSRISRRISPDFLQNITTFPQNVTDLPQRIRYLPRNVTEFSWNVMECYEEDHKQRGRRVAEGKTLAFRFEAGRPHAVAATPLAYCRNRNG